MPTRKIRDLDPQKTCRDPEHLPPTHIMLGSGVYEHECPTCGKVTEFTVRHPIYTDRGITYWGNERRWRADL